MAEYINVEELVNAFIHNEIDNKGQTVGEVIDSLPTIDIVHCKDCKYRGEGYIHSTKFLPCMAVEKTMIGFVQMEKGKRWSRWNGQLMRRLLTAKRKL